MEPGELDGPQPTLPSSASRPAQRCFPIQRKYDEDHAKKCDASFGDNHRLTHGRWCAEHGQT
jgi:hypothetical protein